ncbi:heparinase II/III family protein [Solirhodobacter olei]|uniref:heparinase II/III family protein n=1 Tax=Solirhodobacter olei TaxID=2493082 RepID=UPI000FD8116E|nr:heparinase II/III family protein [Solirhodobacter olei]
MAARRGTAERREESGWTLRKARLLNRWHARLATLARPATGFVSQPEPRTIGSFARGRQLVAGNFLFSGSLVEGPGVGLWDLPMPDAAFEEALQGFAWLDDLAAVGDAAARGRAQDWTYDWIARYGHGRGPGWTPDLTGRRLIRWINHALFLMSGRPREDTDLYFRSLAQQTNFLSRRWQAALPGLPRFEALTGLIYAGLALTGMERHVVPAAQALARECSEQIGAGGGIPTRNPEELLEVFTLLTWAAQALAEAGRVTPRQHMAAIERIAPTLRALRHADGGLARFHGGGRGLEGRLDHALAASGVRAAPPGGLAMGFARLSGGRTSVIVDVAAPPAGAASGNAHASTLAFELTSGRRPLIVNCGSGAPFGAEWRRAGRATPSHSTLAIEGFSSSRLGPPTPVPGGTVQEPLLERAQVIHFREALGPDGMSLIAGHTGYVASHGLSHMRAFYLSEDGRSLSAEDTLGPLTPAEEARLATITAGATPVRFALRFHLHPDVDAAIDLGGTAVSLALRSGELWIFRFEGPGVLAVEPSVYLEQRRLKPRASRQIVLRSEVIETAARIRWTLAKAQDTPVAIRDLDRDDVLAE